MSATTACTVTASPATNTMIQRILRKRLLDRPALDAPAIPVFFQKLSHVNQIDPEQPMLKLSNVSVLDCKWYSLNMRTMFRQRTFTWFDTTKKNV
jgi:hypothetical protein